MKRARTTKREIKARRLAKEAEQARPASAIPANWEALQHNQATIPESTYPLFYADRHFKCRDCGSDEIWRATQQKWWYETAKGPIDSIAIRCRSCRRKERERIAAARKVQLEGLARKAQRKL